MISFVEEYMSDKRYMGWSENNAQSNVKGASAYNKKRTDRQAEHLPQIVLCT